MELFFFHVVINRPTQGVFLHLYLSLKNPRMIAGEDRVNDTIKFECMNSLAGYTDNGFRKMTS